MFSYAGSAVERLPERCVGDSMKKQTLKQKLIRLFVVASIAPILILGIYSFYNISTTLRGNTAQMTAYNLEQIDNNLNIWLDSYQDLLYQIYTADDMVAWLDKLNAGEDESVTVNQMRRFMNGLLNAKDDIRAITIITPEGEIVTYDQMTSMTYRSSWIEHFAMSSEELYSDVIRDYQTHVYATQYGTTFANRDYYLFHMAHRIIDYKDLDKECGIVIVSLDEELLQTICRNSEDAEDNFHYIVDEAGRLITFGGQSERIGTVVTDMQRSEEERLHDYEKDIRMLGLFSTEFDLYLYHDEALGWDIVNVTDRHEVMAAQARQLVLLVLIVVVVFVLAMIMAVRISGQVVSSVDKIVQGMRRAENGDLSARIEKDPAMTAELETIADGYNDTMQKLTEAQERQQEADRKQKEAQIAALEAQINPHFLYNTLDTINWMAIDRDEYDISNAINALAQILRYAIVDSNAEVTVREECEWLKRYIYLQQYRVKNQFACHIDVAPEAVDCRIHKLLLQPFVENAIIHGFANMTEGASLEVRIGRHESQLEIRIRDNGTGMQAQQLERIRRQIGEEHSHSHIGIQNVMTRIRMYYGESAQVELISDEQTGTTVRLQLPYHETEVR